MADDVANWFETPADASAAPVEPPAENEASYLEAIRAALEDELAEDERVVLLGEDIGEMGGAFRVTEGLHARFGDERVMDTPMAETAIVGAGIGMAISGMRPIIELQFADFVSVCYDQLVSEAAKLHYRWGVAVPLVVRLPAGGDVGAGPFHSQSPEGIFAHIPGLKLVAPGTVQDAYDLLRAAVADPNPVLYFEHKALYRRLRGPLVRRPVTESLGVAAISRPGTQVTVVTYGGMVGRCLEAAHELAGEGIDAEVLDLRTLVPTDYAAVADSVRRTGRLVVVHEDTLSSGIGAEVATRVVSDPDTFFCLDAPINRVAAPDCPVPFARPLEEAYVPTVARIERGHPSHGGGLMGSVLECGYLWMQLARAMDDRLLSAYKQSRLRGRLLDGHGQEAIPVGAALCLERDDVVAPVHRDMAVHLVRGTSVLTLMRHYLGRETGPACGRDSDVHVGEWDRGVFPMVSHLPDSWPVMGGAALAFKLRRQPRVAMAFCGDGATSTGAWHETVNFAAVQQLPMVMIVEDNQYAYSTPTDRQFRGRLVERACGYGMPGVEVDGNDVEAMHAAVQPAVDRARQGGGPTLIIAETMRMHGHAIHDGAPYVPDGMLAKWAEKDPVARAEARLRDRGWDDAKFDALKARLRSEVRDAWDQAESEPIPTPEDHPLEEGVFATSAP